MFAVFEGIDGSGKQTQIARLVEWLEAKGKVVESFAFPSLKGCLGQVLGDFLKHRLELSSEKQFFVFLADILAHQKKLSEIAGSKIIILDRYIYSTLAYQSAFGFDEKEAMCIVNALRFLQPDIVFLLDIDAKTGIRRKMSQKHLERFELSPQKLEIVRKAFLKLARKKFHAKKWVVIDAKKDEEEIFEEVRRNMERIL